MIKRLRRVVLLVLLFATLAFTANAQSTSDYTIKELSIRLNCPEAQANIEIVGTPGSHVSVQLILPGENIADVYNQDDLMNVFAGLDTLQIPSSGKVVYEYISDDAVGLYTFRVSGEVTKVSYTTEYNDVPKSEPEDFFAETWATNYTNVVDGYVQGPVWLRDYMIGDSAPIYAKLLADRINRRQIGRRYLYIHMDVLSVLDEGEMILWQPDKVQEMADILDNFFSLYYEAGGMLDGIYTDNENVMNTWAVRDYRLEGETTAEAIQRNIRTITDDPLYESYIRPKLVERGFNFAKNTDAGLHELHDIGHYTTASKVKKGDCNYLIWDAVTANYKNECLTKAIYDVATKYYPNVYYANYNSNSRIAATYDTGTHKYEFGGDRYTAGTHSCPVLYSGGGTNGNAFLEAKSLANGMRSSMLSNEDGNVMPWVVSKGYHAYNYIQNDKPYFYEYLFHVAMCNPDALLFYGPRYYSTDPVDRVALNLQGMQEALEEFNNLADKTDAVSLIENKFNTTQFLFSGMYTGGRNLWRVTYDNTKITKEDVITIDGDTIIFSANGETLTFAGGTLIDNMYSEYGFWIETDADVYPTLEFDEVPMETTVTYRYFDEFGIELDEGFDWNDVYTVAIYTNGILENIKDRALIVAKYDGKSLESAGTLGNSLWLGKEGRLVSFNVKNIGNSKLFTWESTESLVPLMPALPWNYK